MVVGEIKISFVVEVSFVWKQYVNFIFLDEGQKFKVSSSDALKIPE